jgi:dTDP-4-dehydrorhamnose 3,5-epimerase
VRETKLEGVLIVEPRVFADERGRFWETWNAERYAARGIPGPFVQDNVSVSKRGVLRGLHYQNPNAQGKLVSVLHGAVYDVAVDLREGSPTFGEWVGVELSAADGRQVWIPVGFAHGFQALCDGTAFSYKCTAPYSPADECGLRWDDPALGIEWPLDEPVVSPKDAAAPRLVDVPADHLFRSHRVEELRRPLALTSIKERPVDLSGKQFDFILIARLHHGGVSSL